MLVHRDSPDLSNASGGEIESAKHCFRQVEGRDPTPGELIGAVLGHQHFGQIQKDVTARLVLLPPPQRVADETLREVSKQTASYRSRRTRQAIAAIVIVMTVVGLAGYGLCRLILG